MKTRYKFSLTFLILLTISALGVTTVGTANATNLTIPFSGDDTSARDIMLVIDTTSQMAYATSGSLNQSETGDDPAACNLTSTCEPMETIKTAALDFIDSLSFPTDRVGIIAFTSQQPGGTRAPVVVLPLTSDMATVQVALEGLKVFEPATCTATGDGSGGPPFGPCLNYDAGGNFVGQGCPLFYYGADMQLNGVDDFDDPSSCTYINLGGGLYLAGSQFTNEPVREDASWVTIFLAAGPANASDSTVEHPYGYCPSNTWHDNTLPLSARAPFCRDASSSTRHSSGDPNYDADDYARDMADMVADPDTGIGAANYTIGLGNLIQNASIGDADAGEQLLEYIALTAGGEGAQHGQYYYAPDTTSLEVILESILDAITPASTATPTQTSTTTPTSTATSTLTPTNTTTPTSTATRTPIPKSLSAPTLRSPRSNVISNNSMPTFLWTAVRGGQTYEIEFATDNTFTNIVDSAIVSGTSHTVLASFDDGLYYWHVRAYDDNSQFGKWSSTRTFTIDTSGPSAPVLLSPAHNASSRTPLFRWNAVPTASSYELEYDDDPGFLSPTHISNIRSNSRRPPAMSAGTYYWQVRAKDATGNWSAWSAPFTLIITGP